MKNYLHILLISAVTLLTISCGDNRQASDSRIRLRETFDSAEATIRNQGNYPKSLDLYLAFIRDAENDPYFEQELMTSYISVAVIYGIYKDLDNAIAYNTKAYLSARKLNETRVSELALTNLAQSYLELRDYDKASRMADSLLLLNLDDRNTIKFHHSIIKSGVALEQRNFVDAKSFIMKADSIAERLNLSRYERSAPLDLMATYYELQCIPDSQLYYLNKVWEWVSVDKDPQPKAECTRSLMQLHMQQGNIEEARKFQDAYLNLTDSLVNLKQFLSISAQHQQSQINTKSHVITTLQHEASYHKAIIIVIATLLALAIAFIGVIIYHKRSLNAAYHALFDKNRQLMATNRTDTVAEGDSSDRRKQAVGTYDRRNRLLYDKIVKAMDSTHDYLNPDFGLSNLVAMVDSNVAYVSKVVKLYSGMNVPSFINEYRVREACRRIADDAGFRNLTFAAIGESVGFSSQVSFNRAFKKATGMPPSVYHKMAMTNQREN